MNDKNTVKISEGLRVTAVVPSLNPDEKLCGVVEGLIEAGFDDIVVIDDGSAPEFKDNFPKPSDKVTLLVHDVNRGKGAAMKTAFRHILERAEKPLGVVTVDGDGQHRPKDVVSCAQAMVEGESGIVLGCRNFDLPQVPSRSRKGNKITSVVFRLLFGMKLRDTQTGLRAIPVEFLPKMIEIEGDRYEYESNMLMALKPAAIPIKEVEIETVYIDENQTSHFRTVRDAARIYALIIKYVLSSVSSFLVDSLAFVFFIWLFGKFSLGEMDLSGLDIPKIETVKISVIASAAAARVISSVYNFIVNKKVVFKGKGNPFVLLLRYYTLAIPILFISAFGTDIAGGLLNIPESLMLVIKIPIDLILYFASFRIQREWVFKDDKEK